MAETKFYICPVCGKIIGVINATPCPTKCCGQDMVPLVPGTTDASLEKHVPVVNVAVGEAPAAEFALTADEKPIAVYAYCNLHGLWKTDI